MKHQPLFMCGFRPFFVLAAGSAPLLIGLWLLVLSGQLLSFNPPGGGLLWHGHELLFGFTSAAIAGFALTAIPEFTGTPAIRSDKLLRLSLVWLLARLSYLASAWWTNEALLYLTAALNLLFWGLLLRQAAVPAWRSAQRQHASFAWALGGLALTQAGFFAALLTALPLPAPAAWLHLANGLIMILIILAASRVSMSVVNGLIEEGKPGASPAQTVYLARPPRRKLAVFCIACCTAAEFTLGPGAVTAWTALAASAAMLNLLNDWHVGRPLFTRWALMLYACYWIIALAYAAMGLAWLGMPWMPSAGRHLMMLGAIGLSILTIMAMVGRIHAGLWLDMRPWIPITAIVLVLAAVLRAWAGLPSGMAWFMPLLAISGLLWGACFLFYLFKTWNVLAKARSDGQSGCAEPLNSHKKKGGGC
ncbi:NnrS family protein [Pusillimonas sp. CC-YST705]|uniref:NnrS family protein n=1 Tax=Mesopusillimonas faecipullorum TaxID=2755040 RepID=A0ABS8CDU6_9BURK|nr:NnrS family protein [Mesopusillimonas faecipullorum]MCB5364203.1 NnrS family protein [Mesopusillimonas faecipullorum]